MSFIFHLPCCFVLIKVVSQNSFDLSHLQLSTFNGSAEIKAAAVSGLVGGYGHSALRYSEPAIQKHIIPSVPHGQGNIYLPRVELLSTTTVNCQ